MQQTQFIRNLGLVLTLVFGISVPASSQSRTWLDANQPTNWNQPGANIPTAPASEFESKPTSEFESNLESCQEMIRPATTDMDRMVTAAGWKLFAPLEMFGETTLIKAMANADGMCRPLDYQVFIFNNGEFVGTLSPTTMNSRSDGSLKNVFLVHDNMIGAEFARYQESDALCCPSAITNVSFEIDAQPGGSVLIPTRSQTSASSYGSRFINPGG